MNDIATYIRIVDAVPTDEKVNIRQQAVNDIGASFVKRRKPADVFEIVDNIASSLVDISKMPTSFADWVGAIINRHSPSFVTSGNQLEILVCALLAAKQKLGQRSADRRIMSTDILAAGLWSALSMQPPHTDPKLEELRDAVLKSAREWALESAEASRNRIGIPELGIKLQEDSSVSAALPAIEAGVAKPLKALRENATLDREEIDTLWWALGGWSETSNSNYHDMKPQEAAVISGLDLGKLLRKLPADAHRHLLMRFASGTELFALENVVEELGEMRLKLAEEISSNPSYNQNSHVFPLMTAIVSGKSPYSEKELTAADWSARSLLESAILHIQQMMEAE